MMSVRRWLTAQYDWTGLARRFYLSEAWEIIALAVVALSIILLFVFGHGPIVTDRVSVNSFAPVVWVELGDLIMGAMLSAFLLSNAFRMYRFIMADTRAPLRLYITEAKAFVVNFATQKRWRECGQDPSRWLKHLILVSGYLTMMTLVIGFIRWFQVDDDSWHFTSIFGYYATAVLLFITVEMFRSRRRKQETLHRYSEFSDWLVLVLLFFTTLTGIIMHAVRLAGLPVTTYIMYVVHLAVAVPMLIVEVPFGKWSHLFYRPLAIFLTGVKEKADRTSGVKVEDVLDEVGDTFMTCLQCGACNGVCPLNRISTYSPRNILRRLALGSATERSVDRAVFSCVTCKACEVNCPRGIDIIHVIKSVRGQTVVSGTIPEHLEAPLYSLQTEGNPWNLPQGMRMEWAQDLDVPAFAPGVEYALFTCCTTAYDPAARKAGTALIHLLKTAGVSFGSLGTAESCCGDPSDKIGAAGITSELTDKNTELFLGAGVRKVITTSPHCMDAFRNRYPGLTDSAEVEHYTALLGRLLGEGRLDPVHEIDCTVTYHDPCYLGRHNGIYEPPRRILRSIPGIVLVEMASNRKDSLCCGGGGGGVWRTDASGPNAHQSLGMVRVQEALESGAEVIATACPYCIRMLNDAVVSLDAQDRICVSDLSELLLKSVAMGMTANTAEQIYSEMELEAGNV